MISLKGTPAPAVLTLNNPEPAQGATAQAQADHPSKLSPSRLSDNAILGLRDAEARTDKNDQRVISLVRDALRHETFQLHSTSPERVVYKASIKPSASANVTKGNPMPASTLTLQARPTGKSGFDLLSAQLQGPEGEAFVDLARSEPTSTSTQHPVAAGGRAPSGLNRTFLNYAVPARETDGQCVMAIDKMPPPKNGKMAYFRTTADLSSLPEEMEKGGLSDLKLAGCERISSVQQVNIIREALGSGPLTVLDLREEPHAVINGLPVTFRGPLDWAHPGLGKAEQSAREQALFKDLEQKDAVTLVDAAYVKGTKADPQTTKLKGLHIQTEEQIVNSAGATYRRVPVTDHNRPSPEATDQLVDVMRHCLQANEAIVVHCLGGRGRTTTAMTMMDMLKNAQHYSAQTIIDRMAKLGYDYNMTDVDRGAGPKRPLLKDRLEFLHAFHDYAANNPGGLPLNWRQWRAKLMVEQGANRG